MAYFGRGKNTASNPYTFPDMYKEYIKDKEIGNPYNVTYKEFVDICSEFYKGIVDLMLEKNMEFKLPFRMGKTRVVKKKVNLKHKQAIDWESTVKYKKKIYHFNEHSNGYSYVFKWYKDGLLFNNYTFYRLVFTRTNKRRLAKLIKAGYDYYEI